MMVRKSEEQVEVECSRCGDVIATSEPVDASKFVCDACLECRGHEPDPGMPNQSQGETFFCDGSCRRAEVSHLERLGAARR